MSDPSDPSPTASAADGVDGFTALNGVMYADVATIGDGVYWFVPAYYDNGLQIVDVSDPSSPEAASALRRSLMALMTARS